MESRVGLFFYIHGRFFVHSCPLHEAEEYGDFLIYPKSHDQIWRRYYAAGYRVDFDYFPRGRFAYRKSDGVSRIFYDRCIGDEIHFIADAYTDGNAEFLLDEHYQCHFCNRDYVI